jgi:DNA polymerase-4
MEQVIMCVDMDAFFASVEQKTNPGLRGRPVAVVGSAGRTVVTTASYEARARGVKTGMSMREARRACPHLIFVVASNARYTHTSAGLAEIFACFTPEFETYSVDEAFLDVTTTEHLFGGASAIGIKIKGAVRARFGIACTVGIGPNVLVSKLASDLGKPDGLHRIRGEDVRAVLEDLPVEELWGIGARTAERLARLGIRTCGELGRAPASLLRGRFGILGETLGEMGLGICRRPVLSREPGAKSIGHSMTLSRDIWEREEMALQLLKLSEMVGRRARRHGLMGRRVTLTIRYEDFDTFSRQATLPLHTNDTHLIYRTALRALDAFSPRAGVRLLGVSISSLAKDPGQVPLLKGERKRKAVLRAMDSINDRMGEMKVTWGSYMQDRRNSGVISPAWRPSGVKYVNLK